MGNDRGGRGAAILYSLVQTCKAIRVDPKTYLTDVLLRVRSEQDLAKLTPREWKKYFAEEVERKRNRVLQSAVATA